MNRYFYEVRGKEKVRDLLEEGLRSQAAHRASASKPGLLHGLRQILLALLGSQRSQPDRSIKPEKAEPIRSEFS